MNDTLIDDLNNSGIKTVQRGVNEKQRPMIRVITMRGEGFPLSLADLNARKSDFLPRLLGDAGIPALDNRPITFVKTAIQKLFEEQPNFKPDFLSVDYPGWKRSIGAYVGPRKTYGVDPSRIERNFREAFERAFKNVATPSRRSSADSREHP